ncbi:MAG: transglutaminase-like domain-containing protein [Motiliproteus sp.]
MHRMICSWPFGLAMAVVACIVTVLWLAVQPAGIAPKPASYPITKQIRYGFTVTNTTNQLIENPKFIAFSPLPLTPNQKLVSLQANQAYTAEQDKLGNQKLEFKLAALAPFASKTVIITAEMALTDQPNPVRLEPQQRQLFTAPERYVELQSPAVIQATQQFNDSQDTAQSIHRWLTLNIEDIGYVAKDRGAAYALKHRQGDCTEYMYSFVALARSQDIPSRSLAGFWLEQTSNLLRAGSYHNWAEFYDGKRWLLADPQRNVFDQNYSNYIAFRHISEHEEHPMGSAERFMAHDPRLRIRMN